MSAMIVDSGIGNVRSVANMVARLPAKVSIVCNPTELKHATHIILPGVGSFDSAVKRLRLTGFWDALLEAGISRSIPILGVCVGMQVFAERSEEGVENGLGWIPGIVRRFQPLPPPAQPIKIPHMGWNTVCGDPSEPLLEGMRDEARFYFVHSYYFDCKDQQHSVAITNHGTQFTSMVRNRNIAGIQFHAEKSHQFGLKLFRNFLRC